MAKESKKRNTDCVYFLASPLTCRKGGECEFRHSEVARLNPRECWYWINSTCRNPICAFRHPPLEGLTESAPEPGQIPSHAAIPTSKANVPCYFYFNTQCIRGDQCPFLHETAAQKLPKAAATLPENPTMENKASSGSDTGPPSIEVPHKTPSPCLDLIKQEESKISTESSEPECEESLFPTMEEYADSSPQICVEENSDDIVKICDEEVEERWESSPGFDVLVDHKEDTPAAAAADYDMIDQERRPEMLRYNVHDTLGYTDDNGYLCELGLDNDSTEVRHTLEYFYMVPKNLNGSTDMKGTSKRKRMSERNRHKKHVADLRDHLKKRRTDGSPQKLYRPQSIERHGTEDPPLFCYKMVSELENNIRDVYSRYPKYNIGHVLPRPRERGDRMRKYGNCPQGFQRSYSRRAELSFSGPKTLEQIKEEKNRAKELVGNDSSRGQSSKNSRNIPWSNDFEGPKSLNEILEAKKRSVSVNSSEDFEKSNGYGTGYSLEYDDEDAFSKKLLQMVSSEKSIGC